MKFKILLVFLLTLIISILFLSQSSFAKTYTLGDVNLDGDVTTIDYLKIKFHLLKIKPLTNETSLKLADINEDESINSADCLCLKRILMGVLKTKEIENLTKQERIEKELNKYALDHPDLKFSVGISNINNNEEYFYKEQEVYRSGCTIKAPYLWYSCLRIQKEKLNWNDIRLQYAETTDGTSVMRRNPKPEYSLKNTMYLTGTFSDNSGYRMLVNCFGTDDFNKFMNSIGSNTKIGDKVGNYNTVTVADRMIEWKKMNEFMQEGTNESKYLQKYLTNISYNFIGDAIGKQTTYMSGWVEKNGTVNDCAIVRSENPYILIILTSDGKDYSNYKTTRESRQNLYNIAKIVDKIWSE